MLTTEWNFVSGREFEVSGTKALGYDSRGNVTDYGPHSFVYDMSDQPVNVSGVGIENTDYHYDGLLKRFFIDKPGTEDDLANVYDLSGTLLGTCQSGIGCNANGHLTSMRHVDGRWYDYNQDSLGRTLSVTQRALG